MNSNVQRTWNFVNAVAEATDVKAIQDVLKQLAYCYGMTTIFGGVIPKDLYLKQDLSKLILVADLPLDWTALYLKRDYVRTDPVIHYADTAARHYSWSDAYRACSRPEVARIIDGEARSFGMCEGFVVPISMLDGASAIMSFGGSAVDMSEEEKSALAFATNYAVGQIIYQKWQPVDEFERLTTRETDCLLWAAEGKTDWEISVILGVGVPTIEKHMRSAREKLGALNKHHAIAKAMRYRVIS